MIGRRKAIFKLAQGEYVSPEALETGYLECPLAQQLYIHGDSLASCVSAVVVPDFPLLRTRLADQTIAALSDAELCQHPAAAGLYRRELQVIRLLFPSRFPDPG